MKPFICLFVALLMFPLETVASDITSATTLDDYLGRVSADNKIYDSYKKLKDSSQLQLRENELKLSASMFSSAQLGSDSNQPSMPVMSYDRVDTQNYSLGVRQDTAYGTSWSLHYDIDYTNYVNMPGGPGGYYEARPVVEITQPILQNGFGKSTRANLSAVNAKWQAQIYNAEAGMCNLLLDAENAYWNLVVAHGIVKIQEKNLNQSEVIFN